MNETPSIPTTPSGAVVKGSATKSSIFSLGAAKSAVASCALAHPVGTAIVGGIILSVSTYYLGKFIGGRRAKRKLKEAQAA